MKLFIWEGHGISTGYHDDGTLVVLAETVEQAREIALKSAPRRGRTDKSEKNRWQDANERHVLYGNPKKAIQRDPQRVIDLETSQVVVFNGGGYD